MSTVYILVAILLFGVFIAIHEFGHFITAKACGVLVHEFSIGMGPLLWQKQGKETAYSLRLLPLGGYCAIEGEDESSDDPRSLSSQSYLRQVLVFVAGAAMNFLLGLLIVLTLYGSAKAFLTPTIVELREGFPNSGENGVMVGDVLYELNGERIYLFSDVDLVMSMGDFDEARTLHAVLLRDGKKIERTIRRTEFTNGDGSTEYAYGFTYGGTVEASAGLKLKTAWYTSLDFVRMTRMSLKMLLSGEAGMKDLSGPVGIVSTMEQMGSEAETKRAGIENILYFGALVSVNLAVMNLLPLPVLDGGKVLFLTLNTISFRLFRKRIPHQVENALGTVCFALLMAMMLFVTYSDISKLFS